MSDLLAALIPELVGLAVTPTAIVACLLLLGSSHPIRNVGLFAGVYAAAYTLLAGIVLLVGRAAGAGPDHSDTVRGWISLGVGLAFLAAAGVSGRQRSRRRIASARSAPGPDEEVPVPRWARALADPEPRVVVFAALVLAVVNPNVAILLSGLGIILTADVGGRQQTWAVLLLLASALVDFAAPTVIYLLNPVRGGRMLHSATQWLLRHDQALAIGALVVFGLLFSARGLSEI